VHIHPLPRFTSSFRAIGINMKKAVWALFAVFVIIWTALAWAAAGLAQWTADAVASDRVAHAAQQAAMVTESATRAAAASVAEITTQATNQAASALAQSTEAAKAAASQAARDATAAANQATRDATAAATNAAKAAAAAAATIPPPPPMPAWVSAWLPPELIQSVESWAAWVRSAAGTSAEITQLNLGKIAEEASASAAAAASTATAASGTALAGAKEATAAAEQALAESAQRAAAAAAGIGAAASATTPWIASIIGWLVPLVWVLWGVGLIAGLLVTLLARWFVGSLSGPRSTPTGA
jgi:hypothetical protein